MGFTNAGRITHVAKYIFICNNLYTEFNIIYSTFTLLSTMCIDGKARYHYQMVIIWTDLLW
jgi:hypothetical protein